MGMLRSLVLEQQLDFQIIRGVSVGALNALRSSGRDFKVGPVSLASSHYQEWGPDDQSFINKVLASASNFRRLGCVNVIDVENSSGREWQRMP